MGEPGSREKFDPSAAVPLGACMTSNPNASNCGRKALKARSENPEAIKGVGKGASKLCICLSLPEFSPPVEETEVAEEKTGIKLPAPSSPPVMADE